MRTIIAIGGGTSFEDGTGLPIHRHLLDRTGAAKPKITYIPTASSENIEGMLIARIGFQSLGATVQVLSLFSLPSNDLIDWMADSDLIYVGGGNTKSMLALWKEWEVDTALKHHYDQGKLIAGVSAGANCWFESCSTDSYFGPYRALPALGWIKGSFCPHLESEPERRPTLETFLSTGAMASGYTTTDGAALEFHDENLVGAMGWLDSAKAFRTFAGTPPRFEPIELTWLHR
ncbi:MAG: Type 1 glutamine amidotransferase-like domain-containing protein [Armatimonadetes bacterium]|nr:Type 1 glutamine amidotransferase-like domain-containing protein [Armatimonadota bacterium]